MELKLDLTKRDKNTQLFLVVGLVFIVASIGYIIIKYFGDKKIETFDWGYFVPGMGLGIFYFIKGLKEQLKNAYIIINDLKLAIKEDDEKRERTIFWVDVERIEATASKYKFVIQKRNDFILQLAYYDQNEILQITDVIKKTASAQNIPVVQVSSIE